MEITFPRVKLCTSGLEGLADLAPEVALSEAASLLGRLTRRTVSLDAFVLALLAEAGGVEQDWHVAHRIEGKGGSYSLEVFVWPPGSRTKIHDHASWGAYRCVVGSLLEERYERLDDGRRLEYARLRKVWQLLRGKEDGVSTVQPFEGGIHRVGNAGKGTAISVHLYGPQVGEIDGRDYDSSHDFVCDRGIS